MKTYLEAMRTGTVLTGWARRREHRQPRERGVGRLLMVATMALCATTNIACYEDGPSTLAATPTRYFLFGDGSMSVDDAQADRWGENMQSLVFDRLRPGDAVVVFAVTDRTGEQAPLFDEVLPADAPEAGMDEAMAGRQRWERMIREGTGAIAQALHAPVRSRETHLLASLRRIAPDPDRQTVAIFLTDGVESSPDLDLERTKLSDENIVSLLEGAGRREGWGNAMLRGVKVRFVLDSPQVNVKKPLNDRRSLERFWRTAVTSLGGDLERFDSRIGD